MYGQSPHPPSLLLLRYDSIYYGIWLTSEHILRSSNQPDKYFVHLPINQQYKQLMLTLKTLYTSTAEKYKLSHCTVVGYIACLWNQSGQSVGAGDIIVSACSLNTRFDVKTSAQLHFEQWCPQCPEYLQRVKLPHKACDLCFDQFNTTSRHHYIQC